jgi:predicted SAM-dependent methyltransferase
LDVVGKLWLNHYEEFYKFIKNDIKNKIVLEIGDPSCKIAKFANEDVKSWSIIEKNVNHSVKLNNVFFIKDWFDKRYVNKCDIIIHSHVLEHMFDIKSFLKTLNKCLELNGKMFFSVPNFDYLLKKTFLPVNLLHFEHTFCFTRKLLVKLLLAFGFKVNRVFNYKNHSLFFECRKISSNILEKYFIKTCKTHYKSFIFNYKRVKMLVNKFNNIDVCEKFIFSSHVSTQFMISAGLNLKNVKYLLDNSEKKQNKYLYGVDVIIKSPDIIKNIKNPVVLISHCSIYKKEISKQLRKLNKGVILI